MSFFTNLFGKGGGHGGYRAALDIGSSGVRGLLFMQGERTTAIVPHNLIRIAHTRMEKEASSAVMNVGDISRMVKALVEAEPRFASVPRVAVGFGSELLRGTTFRAVFERDDARHKIDEAEFKNLLEKAERGSREHIAQYLSREVSGFELHLLTSRLEEILIDGYGVTDPIGLSGKTMEIALFNLYAEESSLEFLKNLKKALGRARLTSGYLPYAVSTSYARAMPATSFVAGVFIDVGESKTSVSVVSRGVFFGSKSFSVGGGMFTRSIATSLSLGFGEAEDVKLQYAVGTLSAQTSRRVSGILSRGAAVWASGVELALEEFSGALELFPSTFFFCGGASLLPDLVRVIGEPERFPHLPFLEKRTAVLLEPSLLPFVERAGMPATLPALTAGDVPLLALASLSMEEERDQGSLAKLVRQATHLAYS